MKIPKIFGEFLPQTPSGLCPGPAGGRKPPADYSDRCAIVFSK